MVVVDKGKVEVMVEVTEVGDFLEAEDSAKVDTGVTEVKVEMEVEVWAMGVVEKVVLKGDTEMEEAATEVGEDKETAMEVGAILEAGG